MRVRLQIPGLKAGHTTLKEALTGCTVILHDAGGPYAVQIVGGAAALRQASLTDPFHSARTAHGFFFTGGSGFGLGASTGVLDFLSKKGVGIRIGDMRIPSVPAAAIYDLRVGSSIWPLAEHGYQAASRASEDVHVGRVGAGTGARVGKFLGLEHSAPGGFAVAQGEVSGVRIAAFAVVNAFGSVRDPESGSIVAGPEASLLGKAFNPVDSTTLALVVIDAAMDHLSLARTARIAQGAFYRVFSPAATQYDGDVLFVWAVGRNSAPDPLITGIKAQSLLERAFLSAVNP